MNVMFLLLAKDDVVEKSVEKLIRINKIVRHANLQHYMAKILSRKSKIRFPMIARLIFQILMDKRFLFC